MKKVIAILVASLVLLTSCVIVKPVVNHTSSESSSAAESISSAEQSEVTADFDYKTYANARYGFTVPYPDYFTSITESDNGDGATLSKSDTGEELKVWGAYNIDNLNGKAMLEEAKTRVSQIAMEDAQDDSFYILYQGGNGSEGGTINFFEYGLVKDDIVVRFLFRYPVELEEQYDDIIKQMTTGLSFGTSETAKG